MLLWLTNRQQALLSLNGLWALIYARLTLAPQKLLGRLAKV
jgi:hypothetical protein